VVWRIGVSGGIRRFCGEAKNVVCEQKGMASGCGSAKVVVIVELNFLLASCCCQGCRCCCCCGGGDRE